MHLNAGLFPFLINSVQLRALARGLGFVLGLRVWDRVRLGVSLEVRLGISIFCAEGAVIFDPIVSTFEVVLIFQVILGYLRRGEVGRLEGKCFMSLVSSPFQVVHSRRKIYEYEYECYDGVPI